MTLFSIRKGALPVEASHFQISKSLAGISLHILGIIVLAEPSDFFDGDTRPNYPSVRGVKSLPILTDVQLEVKGN